MNNSADGGCPKNICFVSGLIFQKKTKIQKKQAFSDTKQVSRVIPK